MTDKNAPTHQLFENQREFDEKRVEGRAANITKKRQYQDDDKSLDGFQSCNASQVKNSSSVHKSSRPKVGNRTAKAELSDSAKKALADFMNTSQTSTSDQKPKPVVNAQPK